MKSNRVVPGLRSRPLLFLCGGLQSSGSTLVSWCFLQRGDMNGVLDAATDLLPAIDPEMGQPHVWFKTTISSFPFRDHVDHYRDQGWEVRPLLVIRDLRRCWASLQGKPYACNGITAEDPPLRMRMRRFLADWEVFRRRQWPMLRYESLLETPEARCATPAGSCSLPGTRPCSIGRRPTARSPTPATATPASGKPAARTSGHHRPIPAAPRGPPLAEIDLSWLGERSTSSIASAVIPREGPAATSAAASAEATPNFQCTRRHRWETYRPRLQRLLSLLGVRDRSRRTSRGLNEVA